MEQVVPEPQKYFQSYADIEVHRLMLQDDERMKSYKAAIMANKKYIEGKTVMDVGAGTGVLSIFCAMAGAKKVYAVEASDVAELAESVIKENKFQKIIEVIHSKVEDVKLPNNEKVDIIVSEWMGFYLLHEGMLDSVLVARDKFLKPGGYMFPESATIYMAPCSVPSMYNFWEDIHGVKMNSLGSLIRKSDVNKPKVIEVKESQLLSEPVVMCWIDLKENTLENLDSFTARQVIGSNKSGYYQGMCIWFECLFPAMSGDNTECAVILCTAPKSPPTHWKQTVIVLPNELLIEKGQPIAWELNMKRSDESSRRYILQLELLDPTKESHPMPCSCDMTKCIVIRTYLQQYTMEHEPNNSEDSSSTS
ncbi:arginine methyltransferase 8 [Arctopsyche grandis]|uniref:arginine methyltransferase 8 n=1 Tax=Arctopsyche grandis TaxID=121162 RepID=UPI00406D87A7